MKFAATTCSLLLAFTSACNSLQSGVSSAPSMEEMGEAMMRAGTPGPEHRALDAFVGSWNAEVTYWWSPDAPPSVSQGRMVTNWSLDGHVLEQRYEGSMEGMPFSGLALAGYDVAAAKYWGMWVDSMSTSIMYTTGTRDAAGTYVYETEGTDPMSGKRVRGKEEMFVEGPNRHRMLMYEDRGGGMQKVMEIVYTRAM